MRQFYKVGIISLLLIGLGLFIWTFIPKDRLEEEFILNPNFSLFLDEMECSQPHELIESKYIVNYSKAIRFKESGDILVAIKKSNTIGVKNYQPNSFGACTVSLEVWVDGKEMLLEPGNRIIEPYLNKQTQMFMFMITPLSAHLVKGTLWIYAVFPNKKDALLERIPLFAIPFTIPVESLFGYPPKIIRIFAFLLTLLVLMLLNFPLDPKKS